MNNLQKLARLFSEFPGIGPRQSKRFVYFLLTRNNGYIEELLSLVKTLKRETVVCTACFRYFPKNIGLSHLCPICSDTERNSEMVMVVSRDIDFENIEKTDSYAGKYFILGGTVPILEKEPESKVRVSDLLKRVEKQGEAKTLKEIILAMNANPEGENTADYVREMIEPLAKKFKIKVSTLGRGLATGAELEYSDSETIKNALKNRQ